MPLVGSEVPYLEYEVIKSMAEEFLSKYHPEGFIPVPIQAIVEFEFGLDIFPIPNLKNLLDIEGCIAFNIRTIFVDQSVLDKIAKRYRFTLAHELAHFVLHREVLKECEAKSSEKVLEFIRNISEGTQSRMEYQAYAFAGLVLVPTDHLELAILEAISMVPKELKREKCGPEILEYISQYIGDKFQVSGQVIKKRIESEPHLKKHFE
jgi:hypothetical protein